MQNQDNAAIANVCVMGMWYKIEMLEEEGERERDQMGNESAFMNKDTNKNGNKRSHLQYHYQNKLSSQFAD